MDDMDHAWEFLKRLRDVADPEYRKFIAPRLEDFKYWNPEKIGQLRELVDSAYRQATVTRVDTANFALESHSLWLDILVEARKCLS
jgi:hypothetical protein